MTTTVLMMARTDQRPAGIAQGRTDHRQSLSVQIQRGPASGLTNAREPDTAMPGTTEVVCYRSSADYAGGLQGPYQNALQSHRDLCGKNKRFSLPRKLMPKRTPFGKAGLRTHHRARNALAPSPHNRCRECPHRARLGAATLGTVLTAAGLRKRNPRIAPAAMRKGMARKVRIMASRWRRFSLGISLAIL
jgi:hypothetical protein